MNVHAPSEEKSDCSEREMIFKILSFSSIGINVNYLLSELMSNNAELL